MTTESKFFEKILKEGEKAKPLYKDYNFDILSDKEKKFLNSLSYFSKYKAFLIKYVFSRKVKTRDQISYIETYKQQLDYANYIKYQQVKGQLQDYRQLSLSVFVFGFLGTAAIFLIRKDPHKGIARENFFSLLAWSVFSVGFYNWCLRDYFRVVNEVYRNLENDLNTNYQLKTTRDNPNFLSGDDMPDDLMD